MTELIPLMVERVGILVMLAFLLSRMKFFRQMVDHKHELKDKLILIGIFVLFGIVSNYTGVAISGGTITSHGWQLRLEEGSAIANTRIMGVAIGGLLGGPIVGIGTGIVVGLHRLTLGGYTAVACAISTILAGFVTGFIGTKFNIRQESSKWKAVIIGVLIEVTQMGIILIVAKPFDSALYLVKVIAPSMILINGLGMFLFVLLIQGILLEEEKTRTLQTHKALYIADQTLPYFRKGLTVESSKKVAELMLRHTEADAISITDCNQVLAHVGVGEDHHIPQSPLSTTLTKRVLEQREILKATSSEDIQCSQKDCPLKGAIVLPLNSHDKTVGTLKLYYTDPNRLDLVQQELAEGLSKLFSTQLELAEAEFQRKLLKDAEIKALQAQVHPHFLFNAINTVSALIRTDADQARKLLLHLSTFFRSNLQGARQHLIPLEKELEHVEAYLAIEQARFPGKYTIHIEIDAELYNVLIPPFTLQPLVENAMKHAFSKGFKGKCIVKVKAFLEGDKVIIVTEDNGKGIPEELIKKLGHKTVASVEGTGTALWNIKTRIEEIYGGEGVFKIKSKLGVGTKVFIIIPLTRS